VSAKIEEIQYLNGKGFKISNTNYEAVVLPEKGANLIQLYNKKNRVNILREPKNEIELDQKPFEYGIPILFFPNRIEDGRFLFNKHLYQFPVNEKRTNCHLHGFLYDKKWNVGERKIHDEKVAFEMNYILDPDNEIYDYFPHPCEFRMRIVLSAYGLSQEMRIQNRGDKVMPIGLGYHTSFSVPFEREYKVYLPAGEKWETNDRHFPTGEIREIKDESEIHLERKGKKIFGHFMCKEKLFRGEKYYGAVIENKEKKNRVYYLFEKSFQHVVVWNKNGDEDFICIEPQTCSINAFNIDLPYRVTGVRSLAENAIFKANTLITMKD
jgi:aldose 1-epimerase